MIAERLQYVALCLWCFCFCIIQLLSSTDASTITSEVDINEVSVPCCNLLTRGVTQDDVCIILFCLFSDNTTGRGLSE